ncbi:DNA-binding MarR family transcriptional regulator [Novosphingobium sp. SG751A]|uniref:MarR family winged helix-turn-helix transcriptional regulator n=1 Tax=Novosphingobium sp. SG751A TaxID=2587000 RepID=UPI0020A68620|nr:MarR family winged helix-turn-helix transcriptional regulator [Novosphingobium sp. SG751A]NOW47958.1 DNA-binding MarR family transcriptional regulator [Novosphingobium sp. SG751A]
MNWTDRNSAALAGAAPQIWKEPEGSQPVNQRLRTLAQSLLNAAMELEKAPPAVPVEDGGAGIAARPKSDPAEQAQQLYRERRRRIEAFGDDTLFGEPAWDILLDLFVAGERGKRVAVTSACIGSGVPSTTALRWLNVLELRGMVEREDDNHDARRSFVRLTAKARAMMLEYFANL